MKNSISTPIEISKTNRSKIEQVDFENLNFGKTFTDHMFICNYANGVWETPKIIPYGPLTLDPSSRVFHYGQAVFEGMKAYKDEHDDIFMFRPEENFNRINASAKRLCIPEFPEAYFFDGLKTLLELDSDWIKPGYGNSLYIRPFVIATEASVLALEADEYSFMIICSPAQSYYAGEVNLLIEEKYSRSASGGFGYAKAAGNYAGQFYPTNLAKDKGYQQLIWTDSNTHEYIEEAGTMNVFFRINDTLRTAPISDRILDGITRKSLLEIAKREGITVDVSPIRISEIITAAENGTLKEVFGAGTAAVISPVKGFGHQGTHYDIEPIENSYASFFKKTLMDIQYNKAEDTFGWRYKV